MKILCLDPADSCGYSIMSINSDRTQAIISEYGFIDVDNSSNYQGDHCLDLMRRITEIIKKHSS